MAAKSRIEKIKELFPSEPAFRLRQIDAALFDPQIRTWSDISTLPQTMREQLTAFMPFMTVDAVMVQSDRSGQTYKALLRIDGDATVETVLMKNSRGAWTICVSSQVGCAMRCAFCATGRLGLKRNLTSDEIVDQYRFWQQYLVDHEELGSRISNIVYMGMGEPLANYENVKTSLNNLLANTDIGKTRITVSTAGVMPRLEQLLEDPDWPHVRLAVSLHSANELTRRSIMPSSYEGFLHDLKVWSRQYLKKFGNRRHHLTFEYILLAGVNDNQSDADELAKYVRKIGNVRINLIPYNFTGDDFFGSDQQTINDFQQRLMNQGVTVTVRKSLGQDIAAACGQLAKNEK